MTDAKIGNILECIKQFDSTGNIEACLMKYCSKATKNLLSIKVALLAGSILQSNDAKKIHLMSPNGTKMTINQCIKTLNEWVAGVESGV